MLRDFNFFSSYHKTKQNSQKRIVTLAALAVFVLFISFIAVTVNYAWELRINAVRYEIESNKLILSNPGNLKLLDKYEAYTAQLDDLKTFNEKVELLSDGILEGASIDTKLLRSIELNITADTSVDLLSVSSDTINIYGVSGSEISIAEFERNMAHESFVESVFVSSIYREEQKYIFTMSIKIKEVPGDVEN